jgi:hypothetical protein
LEIVNEIGLPPECVIYSRPAWSIGEFNSDPRHLSVQSREAFEVHDDKALFINKRVIDHDCRSGDDFGNTLSISRFSANLNPSFRLSLFAEERHATARKLVRPRAQTMSQRAGDAGDRDRLRRA